MPIYPGRRPKTHRVTVFAHGKQNEWIVEGTRRDALAFEAQKRLDLRARPPVAASRGVPTFSTFCREQYAPHAVLHLGADTWNKVRVYQVNTLSKFFGAKRLDELSDDDVEAFKRHRQSEKTRAGTPTKTSSINNELRVLKTMLRWGREEKLQPIPPLKIRMLPKPGKRRVRAWSLDEVRRLYAAAQTEAPELVPMLHFLLETGCRKGEALAFEWSWIDWDAKMLRIPVTEYWKPKDKEAREVPLSNALIATLRSLPRRSEQYVFPNRFNVRYQTFPEKTYRKVTAKAKLGGGPHTTRHTYASHFLQARPDLPLLAEVLGHSTTYVTELYTHMLPGHLERARNAVQLAPPSKLWRPTLAKVPDTPKSPKKTNTRH